MTVPLHENTVAMKASLSRLEATPSREAADELRKVYRAQENSAFALKISPGQVPHMMRELGYVRKDDLGGYYVDDAAGVRFHVETQGNDMHEQLLGNMAKGDQATRDAITKERVAKYPVVVHVHASVSGSPTAAGGKPPHFHAISMARALIAMRAYVMKNGIPALFQLGDHSRVDAAEHNPATS